MTTVITILTIISTLFVASLLAFGIAISQIIVYTSIKEKDWFNLIISAIATIVFLGIAVTMILGFVVGGII